MNSVIRKINKLNKNEKIIVLIKNPGIHEKYVDYCLEKDKIKYEELRKLYEDGDAMPTFKVKDFLHCVEINDKVRKIVADKPVKKSNILQFVR